MILKRQIREIKSYRLERSLPHPHLILKICVKKLKKFEEKQQPFLSASNAMKETHRPLPNMQTPHRIDPGQIQSQDLLFLRPAC